MINNSRGYGIEIEAFNIGWDCLNEKLNAAGIDCQIESYNHRTSSHWKIVMDCSIHGINSFELVSPILYGENGLSQIQKVCSVLNQLNAKVNRSCGLHVHHDARDFGRNGLQNIFNFYKKVESIIDEFMPVSRRNNNRFCLNLTSYERALMNRYHKLNLVAYERHGSIEFRQHSGTTEFQKIKNWVIFTQAIVEKAKNGVSINSTVPLNAGAFIMKGLLDGSLSGYNNTQLAEAVNRVLGINLKASSAGVYKNDFNNIRQTDISRRGAWVMRMISNGRNNNDIRMDFYNRFNKEISESSINTYRYSYNIYQSIIEGASRAVRATWDSIQQFLGLDSDTIQYFNNCKAELAR